MQKRRYTNGKIKQILKNRKPTGKASTMVSSSVIQGKRRGNLIFTGNGIRIKKINYEVPVN